MEHLFIDQRVQLVGMRVSDNGGSTFVPLLGPDIDAGGEIDFPLVLRCFYLDERLALKVELLTTVVYEPESDFFYSFEVMILQIYI